MGVQVQSATKKKIGGVLIPLPIIQKQFISFSYGGRRIEDFDLLVVFNGDRLQKEIYSSFKDITSEQAELDGQLFWRSNFNAGQLNFTLATDGITSQQLEDFKNWFKPGVEKELILSEHHNRGILARISSSPQISLLPFEKEVEVKVGNEIKKTRTSLYKGEISLSFVMDDPEWYSLDSFIKNETLFEEDIKLIYEDGIPSKTMINTSCFLADNYFCQVEENNGQILSRVIKENSGVKVSGQEDQYLYYCGTGKEKPIISFEITPVFHEDNGKISFLKTDENDFYYLSLGSESVGNYQEFKFSLPSLFSSYNNALDVVLNTEVNTSILDLRRNLRDVIYNYSARSWVMAIIDYARANKTEVSGEGNIGPGFKDFFIRQMKNFIPKEEVIIENLEAGEEITTLIYTPLKCVINSKTGEVLITEKINFYNGGKIDSETNLLPVSTQTITENAGNMVKSNYLTIDVRTLPQEGKIMSTNCLLVKTNTELNNLKINYKYKYL